MSSLTELLEAIQEFNKEYGHEKEWEILRDRIMSSNETKEYWFTLLKDVNRFFKVKCSKVRKRKTARIYRAFDDDN